MCDVTAAAVIGKVSASVSAFNGKAARRLWIFSRIAIQGKWINPSSKGIDRTTIKHFSVHLQVEYGRLKNIHCSAVQSSSAHLGGPSALHSLTHSRAVEKIRVQRDFFPCIHHHSDSTQTKLKLAKRRNAIEKIQIFFFVVVSSTHSS